MINTELYAEISDFAEKYFEEYKELIKSITAIPAPSHKEDKRVKYLLSLLNNMGIKAHTDIAKNVIVDEFFTGADTHMYMAHIDTVFPDEDTIKVVEEDGKIKGAGVGDDTTNVAAILMTLKFIKERGLRPDGSIIFALNSCEEGLGNLKGSRQLAKDYGDKLTQVISFDCGYESICNKAVGSKRYEITIKTKGGHSYYDFGNGNAIEYMAKLINQIYKTDISDIEGKNTYNVGVISGGTSVNTIAEDAKILFEYRSDSDESLEKINLIFKNVIKAFLDKYNKELEAEIKCVGERPSERGVDMEKQLQLSFMGKETIKYATDFEAEFCSASTDCNIPLSMGIPAICYGTYTGGGQHTREEYVNIDSLKGGLRIAMLTILQEFCGK